MLRDDHAALAQGLALLRGAGQRHHLHGVTLRLQVIHHLREQVRGGTTVVQRHLGRRPQHHDHPRRIQPQLGGHAGVGRIVGQVVFLLEARVADQLRGADPVPDQRALRDGIGHQHAGGEPSIGVMHGGGELVVEHRHLRDPREAGGHRLVRAAVRHRQVEVLAAGQGHEAGGPRRHRAGLPAQAAAAMRAHGAVGYPVPVQQPDGLGEVAGCHHHLVPALLHPPDERPEDQDVR